MDYGYEASLFVSFLWFSRRILFEYKASLAKDQMRRSHDTHSIRAVSKVLLVVL